MTIDTPISLLAPQMTRHAAFAKNARFRSLCQGTQQAGHEFGEEDVHFLCIGTISFTRVFSDNDEPILSREQTYRVAANMAPALLPLLTQEFALNAVTDAALFSIGKHDFRVLLEASRDFRAMVFAAAAKGIAQSSQGLIQHNAKDAAAFEACEPDAFWHSQRRPSELHRMSVQWLLQKQKGKPQ